MGFHSERWIGRAAFAAGNHASRPPFRTSQKAQDDARSRSGGGQVGRRDGQLDDIRSILKASDSRSPMSKKLSSITVVLAVHAAALLARSRAATHAD